MPLNLPRSVQLLIGTRGKHRRTKLMMQSAQVNHVRPMFKFLGKNSHLIQKPPGDGYLAPEIAFPGNTS